jgi:hypothetical protein
MSARRLRVLAGHPVLGQPNDIRTEFDGAQAYVDAGYAEWIVTREATIETTDRAGAPETAVTRPVRGKRVDNETTTAAPVRETRSDR